jgi:small-conductance mechanosensitive channel
MTADSEPALTTDDTVVGQVIAASLALRCTLDAVRIMVATVVVLAEISGFLANPVCARGSINCWSTGHDVLRTSVEEVVIPVGALASLPVLGAEVAELVLARATASDCQHVST